MARLFLTFCLLTAFVVSAIAYWSQWNWYEQVAAAVAMGFLLGELSGVVTERLRHRRRRLVEAEFAAIRRKLREERLNAVAGRHAGRTPAGEGTSNPVSPAGGTPFVSPLGEWSCSLHPNGSKTVRVTKTNAQYRCTEPDCVSGGIEWFPPPPERPLDDDATRAPHGLAPSTAGRSGDAS